MELQPGAVALYRRTFSQDDFDRFASLSGDDNPIHVDPAFAARTRFGRTVCHGMLLYSTICAALTREVGPGYEQHDQELMFVTPTYTGEEVVVRLEVTALSHEHGSAKLSTAITRPDGSVACQGSTCIRLPGAAESPIERITTPGASSADLTAATGHKGLQIGQAADVTKIFSDADLAEYAALTGDTNPAYTGTLERTGQVPPGLLGGLFSFLLGTRLPGRGTNWLKQRLVFPSSGEASAAAPVGEPIHARVEVVRLRPDKDLVNLSTICTLNNGRAVCLGEALVLVKDLECS
jgi:acyl dehydratase